MWHKVTWLFLWMTLAFWSGCAGVDRSAKVYQEEIPLFRQEYLSGAGAVPIDDAEPSVIGVERDNWLPVAIQPARGLVPHHPAYFSDEGHGVDLWRVRDRPTPLDLEGIVEHQADFATAGARESLGRRDIVDAVLLPLDYAADLVTFPYHVVKVPPWEIRYSPEYE